jgi:hypothetical protein
MEGLASLRKDAGGARIEIGWLYRHDVGCGCTIKCGIKVVRTLAGFAIATAGTCARRVIDMAEMTCRRVATEPRTRVGLGYAR